MINDTLHIFNLFDKHWFEFRNMIIELLGKTLAKGIILLSLIVSLSSCDTWTSTFVQNSTNHPIIIELIQDSSNVKIDTMRIEYRKHPGMDSILKTNCCLIFRINSDNNVIGVICSPIFTVSKSRWKNINCQIDSADFSYKSLYCSTLDKLPDGKIQINYTIGPNDVFFIGRVLGISQSTYYDELHIKWKNDDRFDTIENNRIDLIGRNSILSLAKKSKNCFIIEINDRE